MRRFSLIAALAVVWGAASGGASAQPLPAGQAYAPGVDVTRYSFEVALSDTVDRIEGRATVYFTAMSDTTTVLPLDLVSLSTEGTGMRVSAVAVDDIAERFTHTADRLVVYLARTSRGGRHRAVIEYSGVPADGLIIGVNRHGERTFFGDHWPNRARNWLPVVDHPSDKALVDWSVTAPSGYQVVANGRLAEETDGPDGTRLTRWEADRPIATKIAVIGVARFAVEYRRPVVAA
ncbi:MAG TPA: hypothetical protein VF594_07810, partial [Rubricoccaceae bacterium]